MKLKNVHIFVSALLLLGITACGGGNNNNSNESEIGSDNPSETTSSQTSDLPTSEFPINEAFDAWVESSYVNVFKDSFPSDYAKTEVDWILAKNEYESAQLVLVGIEDYTIESVEFTDLVSGENKIDKENLKYNFVEYVKLNTNSPGVSTSLIKRAPYDYPDALSNETSLSVAMDETQPIWVTIYVPKTTPAGEYKGHVTVKTTEGDVYFKVNAEVNNVVVPDQGSSESKYNIAFWQLMIGGAFNTTYPNQHKTDPIYLKYGNEERYTERWWRIVGSIAQLMKENRLNTLYLPTVQLLLDGGSTYNEDGTWTFNWSKFDEYVHYFLDKGIVNEFMGYQCMTGGETNLIIRDSKGVSCTGKTDFNSKLSDDWFSAYFSALYDHLVEKGWDKMWTQCLSDEPPVDSKNAQNYIKLKGFCAAYLRDIPYGDPANYYENAKFLVDNGSKTLIPLISVLNDYHSMYENLEGVERIYSYSCVGPQGKHLNRFIDQPVYYGREIGWYNFNAGANGYLCWGLMCWYRPITDFANGDTATIYPDPEHDSVKNSIRLAAVRDGAEDYELLKLLEEKDPVAAKTLADCVAINSTDYCRDTGDLESYRAELIHALNEGSNTYKPSEIEVNEDEINMDVYSSTRIDYSIKPLSCLNDKVVFSSDNEKVATVKDGVVYALSSGTANITIASRDYPTVSTTFKVTVNSPITDEQISIKTIGDGYVVGGNFINYRYGNEKILKVCKADPNSLAESYVMFDTTGVDENAENAYLNLYVESLGSTTNHKLVAYEVENFNELTLSYATKPELGDEIGSVTIGKQDAKSWIEIDISDFAIENRGKIAIAVVDESASSTTNNLVTISSRESLVSAPYISFVGSDLSYEPVKGNKINIPEQKDLHLREEFNINASLDVAGATTPNYTYSSSDETVAVVDIYGNVTAVGFGEATITVSENINNLTSSFKVNVKDSEQFKYIVPNADATIESHRPDMNFGTLNYFLANNVQTTPPERHAVMQFCLSEIDELPAKLTLRLYALESGKSATNKIAVYLNNNVNPFEESAVTWNNAPKYDVKVGEISLDNATPDVYGSGYRWLELVIDSKLIRNKENFSLTFVAVEGDRINLSSKEGVKCPYLIVDLGLPANSIEADNLEFEVPGEIKQIEYTIDPAVGHKVVTFESTNTDVVSVDENGNVRSEGSGSANIIIRCGELEKEISVVVKSSIEIETITVNTEDLNLAMGDQVEITASYLPENANNGTELVWESSNPDVVKYIDGKLYAVKPGNTTVTVRSKKFSDVKDTFNVVVEGINEYSFALLPTKDTTIETHRADQMRGLHEELWIYNGIRYSILDFDLSNVDKPIESIRLYMYVVINLSTGSDTLGVYLSNGVEWSEDNIYSTNAPAKVGQCLGSTTFTKDQGIGYYGVFNISPKAVQEKGILELIVNLDAGTGIYFSSKEGIYAPVLVVDYGEPVTNIEMEDVNLPAPGYEGQLSLVVTPSEGHAPIAFTSSNPEIVTVDENGKLVAVSVGTATITATSGSYTKTCEVVVNNFVEATDVDFEDDAVKVVCGEEFELDLVYTPANANTNLDVTFESSDTSVIKTANGIMYAAKPGKATITVTLNSDTTKTAQIEVEVVSPENTLAFVPVKDTTIETHRADQMRGLNEELWVYTGIRYSILDFDLKGINAEIKSVKLYMYVTINLSKGTDELGIYLSNGVAWTEDNIYSTNAPAKKGSCLGKTAFTAAQGNNFWASFEIDPSVVTGNGILELIVNLDAGTGIYFSSKEGLHVPYLVVEFAEQENPVTNIEMEDVEFDHPGLEGQLQYVVTPSEGHAPIDFYSSDTNVVTVDNEGKLRATGVGTAVITASSGSYSKTCNVVVHENYVATGFVLPETAELNIASTDVITVNYLPENANTGLELIWETSDGSIAKVVDGNIVAGKSGTVTLTAKLASNETVVDSIVVTVKDPANAKSLVPTQDSCVEMHRADVCRGKETYLYTYNNEKALRFSILDFDLSVLDRDILGLKLMLFVDNNLADDKGPTTVEVFASDGKEWTEDNIYVANTPKKKGNSLGKFSAKKGEFEKSYITIDVDTSVVSGNKLELTVYATGGIGLYFSAREGLHTPILLVDYGEPVTSIEMDDVVLSKIGEQAQLNPVILPAEHHAPVFFESLNPNVVAVDENGKLTAISSGTANVIARSGLLEESITVTVEEIPNAEVLYPTKDSCVEMHRADVCRGKETYLYTYNHATAKRYTIIDFDLTNIETTKLVGAELMLYVDTNLAADGTNDKIQAFLSNGKEWTEENIYVANAPAKSGNAIGTKSASKADGAGYYLVVDLDESVFANKDSIEIIVECTQGLGQYFSSREGAHTPILVLNYGEPVTNIELSNVVIERPGLTAELNAVITPSENHAKVTYTSSDETVVTVDANGALTAVKEGSVTITATAGEIVKTCTVTVENNIPATDFTISESESLPIISKKPVAISYSPIDANDGLEVIWSSSDSLVAKVVDGNIISGKSGIAVLTAKLASNENVVKTMTVTVNDAENTKSITPSKDACVEKTKPDVCNGEKDFIYTYNPSAATRYGVFEFDLTPIEKPALTVKLMLFMTHNLSTGTDQLECFPTNGVDWTEAGVKFNNAPVRDGGSIGKALFNKGEGINSYVAIDMDPNYILGKDKLEFVLYCQKGTGIYFQSKEGMYTPILLVDYGDEVTDITFTESVTLSEVGEISDINMVVTPAEHHAPVFLVSGNKNIVAVEPSGRIVATGAGTTEITITSGNVSKTCTVTVNNDNEMMYLNPTKDSCIQSHLPDASEGNKEYLYTYNHATAKRYTIIDFDLSSIGDKTLKSATLMLYVDTNLAADGANDKIQAFLSDNKEWNEDNIKVGNAPVKSGAAIGTTTAAKADGALHYIEIELDLAAFEGKDSIEIIVECTQGLGQYFSSREGVHTPILALSF